MKLQIFQYFKNLSLMLTVVALYTLLFLTTFCLNFTFAYTIKSNKTSTLSYTTLPLSTTKDLYNISASSYSHLLLTTVLPASPPPTTSSSVAAANKNNKRHYEENLTASKGNEDDGDTHHIGIFLRSSFTKGRRKMSSSVTTRTQKNTTPIMGNITKDYEESISTFDSVKLKKGFDIFINFFKINLNGKVDFVDYGGKCVSYMNSLYRSLFVSFLWLLFYIFKFSLVFCKIFFCLFSISLQPASGSMSKIVISQTNGSGF